LPLENEIKSLNKELRAFGKIIAQEELKINGRLKLQGNKRRAEEKTMRSKLNPQFVTPNSNMMYHGQPSPFGSPFGNNMSPLNMFPTMFNDQRFQSQYNIQHDPMFALSDMTSSRERIATYIFYDSYHG
jgi:hypothetical protein